MRFIRTFYHSKIQKPQNLLIIALRYSNLLYRRSLFSFIVDLYGYKCQLCPEEEEQEKK